MHVVGCDERLLQMHVMNQKQILIYGELQQRTNMEFDFLIS